MEASPMGEAEGEAAPLLKNDVNDPALPLKKLLTNQSPIRHAKIQAFATGRFPIASLGDNVEHA